MKRIGMRVILWGFFALIVYSFCLPGTVRAQSESKKWITFGVLCPMSGSIAKYGSYIQNTTTLAVEEVNTKWNPPHGGLLINGQRYYLKFEQYDDEGDPSKSVIGFRRLVERYKVPFIMGPFGTPQVLAVVPISKQLKTFMVGYTASNKAHRMGNPYYLAARPPVTLVGGPLAKACFERGWKKYAVLTDVSDSWVSMGEEFRAEMQRLGGTNLGVEMADTKTTFDFRAVMTKFKNANPDVIATFAYTEPLGAMVNHAREVGYTGHFVANNDYNEGAIKIAGVKNSVGIIRQTMYADFLIAHPEADKTGVPTYVYNLYRKKYPGVPLVDVIPNTWDCALTFFKAMEVAGTTTDTTAMAQSLDKAVKLLKDKLMTPQEGVLPNGMQTGVIELITEVQPDGSFKKVGELMYPTEKLK
jgi:ABC-type branched-subunit amino acid transport system substrate-binding protein